MQETFKDIISHIAQEKGISEQDIFNSLKSIILFHASKKYGNQQKLNVRFNQNGSCDLFLEREVVEDEEKFYDKKSFYYIKLSEAQQRNPNIKPGEHIEEILPFKLENFERLEVLKELEASLKKQQKLQEFNTFYDKIGSVLMGCVKSVDSTEAIISFTDQFGEVGLGTLKRHKMMKTDSIKYNNYIKVYIEDVQKGAGYQIFLSRVHPNFLREILKTEIPEIAEGLIEIKSIARDPGSLAKVAVHTDKLSINPLKVCIGDRGERANNIKEAMSGEKVNFVLWKEDTAAFIVSALSPATILRVTEVSPGRYEAVVTDDKLSQALGRGGQNAYLTKTLCNVKSLKLLTDSEESSKSQNLIKTQAQDLVQNLYIEEMMAHILIAEGFETAEIIANSNIDTIKKIEGFDEEIANILIERSRTFLKEERDEIINDLLKNYSDASLAYIPSLSNTQIQLLRKHNILSSKDLAILDIYELMRLFESMYITLDEKIAANIIMTARRMTSRTNV